MVISVNICKKIHIKCAKTKGGGGGGRTSSPPITLLMALWKHIPSSCFLQDFFIASIKKALNVRGCCSLYTQGSEPYLVLSCLQFLLMRFCQISLHKASSLLHYQSHDLNEKQRSYISTALLLLQPFI